MNIPIKEQMCADCVHRDICKYRIDYISFIQVARDVTVYFDNDYLPLKDVKWIEFADPKCRLYQPGYIDKRELIVPAYNEFEEESNGAPV